MSVTNPASSKEDWSSLSQEEQDQLLKEQMEQEDLLSSPGQAEEMEQEEAASAIDLITGKLDETWTATVLDDVPVELYEPTEAQIEEIKRFTRLFLRIVEAGSIEDLDQDLLDEIEDSDEYLNKLLGGDPEADEGSPMAKGLVAEEGMDYAFFNDPSQYPARLRMELYGAIFHKYQQDMGVVTKFLSQSPGQSLGSDAQGMGSDT